MKTILVVQLSELGLSEKNEIPWVRDSFIRGPSLQQGTKVLEALDNLSITVSPFIRNLLQQDCTWVEVYHTFEF